MTKKVKKLQVLLFGGNDLVKTQGTTAFKKVLKERSPDWDIWLQTENKSRKHLIFSFPKKSFRIRNKMCFIMHFEENFAMEKFILLCR